jgi:3'(2'), 5'-bisphosphate nucleotidase
VIHIPVMHETFMALKDKGAFKVQNNQQQQLLKYSANVNQPPIFAVSRSHLNEQTKDFIQQHQANIIVAGSSLKLTLLAEDKADAYPRFGPTSLWDMAAGHAILKQTGGEIYTLDRQPLVYNVKHILNPDLIAVRHKDIIFNMRVTHES